MSSALCRGSTQHVEQHVYNTGEAGMVVERLVKSELTPEDKQKLFDKLLEDTFTLVEDLEFVGSRKGITEAEARTIESVAGLVGKSRIRPAQPGERKAEMKETTKVTARLLGAPSEDRFLSVCNDNGRVRLFGPMQYIHFCEAICEAHEARDKGEGFYEERNAGVVHYKRAWSSQTAQWGVWVEPGSPPAVKFVFRRTTAGNRVPCVRYGGKREYWSDYKKSKREEGA